jgi:soluble lytic murein transglycosylase
MRGTNKSKSSGSIVLTVLVVLIVAIIFGFIFDFAVTQIELAIYRKPREYQGYVTKYSTEYGVPENLVYAVIKTESNFDPAAVSKDDAVGLMQLTETTFEDVRDRLLNDRYMDAGMRYDPETNIKYGTKYLSYLYGKFGHWDTAIVAYFEGETRVAEWLEVPSLDKDKNGVLDSLPKGYEGGESYRGKVNKSWKYYDKLY